MFYFRYHSSKIYLEDKKIKRSFSQKGLINISVIKNKNDLKKN